jgi:signal transduction histidine kinase
MRADFTSADALPESRRLLWVAFYAGLALLLVPDLFGFYLNFAGGRKILAVEIVGTAFDAMVFIAVFALLLRDNFHRRRAEASLRETNAALLRANEFKLELLSIAAHDLKNPLASLRMLGRLLRTSPDDLAAVTETARHIETVSEEMLTLVHDLIETSALESFRIRLQPAYLDLQALLAAAVDAAQPAAARKQQHIDLEAPSSVLAFLDAARLGQVLQNLLGNAIKFSPPGARIVARLQASAGTADLTVCDEGPGLTAEDLPRLFERFQRLSARPTAGESSTGLGLWIVREIVQLQHGKVWAENNRSSHGAVFHVELPLPAPEIPELGIAA